jgi:hypothetical protein
MRENALHIVACFLFCPSAALLLWAAGTDPDSSGDFLLPILISFGWPCLALSVFMFWLGNPSPEPTKKSQTSGGGERKQGKFPDASAS